MKETQTWNHIKQDLKRSICINMNNLQKDSDYALNSSSCFWSTFLAHSTLTSKNIERREITYSSISLLVSPVKCDPNVYIMMRDPNVYIMMHKEILRYIPQIQFRRKHLHFEKTNPITTIEATFPIRRNSLKHQFQQDDFKH